MNHATFAGRIGRDAELRSTAGGSQVAGFSLAVDQFKGGEKSTLWVDCTIWGDRAAKLEQHLTKGSAVCVAGEAGVRSFEKKDKTTGVSLTCNVRELTFLGRGSEGEREQAAPVQARRERPAPARQDAFIDDSCPF